MADVFSAKKRSEIMALIRSRHNLSTELLFAKILRSERITGWRRHLPLKGNPDFAFPRYRILIFIDGCFWHGCPKHGSNPKSNIDYWIKKLARNKIRDRRLSNQLKKQGWRVIRFWEHSLKNPKRVISRVRNALGHS
jgi:DNA mismatch endonuclease, patch repair protein